MITAKHEGNYRIALTYAGNGSVTHTDAPKEYKGLGEFPSPADFLAEALTACALTTAAIWATGHEISAEGFWAEVEGMEVDKDTYSLASIVIRFHVSSAIPENLRKRLESATLRGCLVGNSLKTDKQFVFDYDI